MTLADKLTIPSRQDIIDAVEAGIRAAGDKLSEERVKNLRSYAQTTTTFTCGAWEYGRNRVPCPFFAVGGRKNDPGAKEFAGAFDKHLVQIIGVNLSDLPMTLDPHLAPSSRAIHLTGERQSYDSATIGYGGESSGR